MRQFSQKLNIYYLLKLPMRTAIKRFQNISIAPIICKLLHDCERNQTISHLLGMLMHMLDCMT